MQRNPLRASILELAPAPPRARGPRWGVVGLLCASLALLGCASDAGGGEREVQGKVVSKSGAPQSGIWIGFYKKGCCASDHAATTEADGSFRVALPELLFKPPAGRVFFQTAERKGLVLHKADAIPDPVVLELE